MPNGALDRHRFKELLLLAGRQLPEGFYQFVESHRRATTLSLVVDSRSGSVARIAASLAKASI